MRIVKALLLPFLLILTLIGVDHLHGPSPVSAPVMPSTPGRQS